MTKPTPITIAYGDGIGPEIMTATLKILEAAGANIDIEPIEIGMQVYQRGITAGIENSAWDSLRKNKVFFKAPITTPQGGGFKSLNVTVRKTLGLYANVRPCVAYHPFVKTLHPNMDVVIVRENEEDLYGGIEYQLTPEVTESLKLISVPGCERIVRYAFEYARAYNRKKVTCMTKDNIMKITDGLFHKTFDRIAKEYPDIQTDHLIIDIGSARLADTPERFDVIVTLNLYGDIISDIAAQVAGSVGLGGSSNIGEQCAMFEAIHGSAPDIAGQNIANPSGLILAALMMLVHINQPEAAAKIHNAWLRTLEDGIHTPDIYNSTLSKEQVGTQEFADAVIERLGQEPQQFKPVVYNAIAKPKLVCYHRNPHQIQRDLVGVDVFIYCPEGSSEIIAKQLQQACTADFELLNLCNRGVKVWPGKMSETGCTDQWQSRFNAKNGKTSNEKLLELLQSLNKHNIEIVKIENLYNFDGKPVYSLGQGE